MNLGTVAVKNVFRNRFRNGLTIAGVMVAILAFVMLRTILYAWTMGAEYAAKDRIATRHKVTFVMTLPKRYAEKIAEVRGIKASTFMNWFGGKVPGREKEFFATIAVDTKTFLDVYDEIVVSPDQKQAWLQDRQGALIGDQLAKRFGWKVGDKVTIGGTIYPGDWEMHISGIYSAARKSVDRATLWFHWDYINEAVKERRKDQVGWIAARVDDSSKTAEISAAIDRMFEDTDTPTLSMSERALQLSFLGAFSAVLKAMDIVSMVILLIMMLILGNTIAMGVRERTNEYAVLKAIGFHPRHLVLFVLAEAAAIGLIGGVLGLLISYPLIQQGMGRWIEENVGQYFPYFKIPESMWIAAPAIAVMLGVLAAIIPAYRASKLNVVDALRHVG